MTILEEDILKTVLDYGRAIDKVQAVLKTKEKLDWADDAKIRGYYLRLRRACAGVEMVRVRLRNLAVAWVKDKK